jgi:glycosyltransferase involved in cell wall biosynthesis
LFRRERPDVAHFTNTFPLISPAAYHAAQDQGVAVVQSLRNYRLLCPSAQLLRDGKTCAKCLGKRLAWPAVWHGCYRGSRRASLIVASMLALHHFRKTWLQAVDQYYALTEFAREKFIQGGLPADKISVKPNFIDPPPEPGRGSAACAVFVGRLSPEKGIDVLLNAWRQLDLPLKLQIVGDGPLADAVRTAADRDARIDWLGRRTPGEVLAVIGEALCLVMPSLWYEGFPRVILESLAKGTPVIASRLGSMEEIVEHGVTGLHFEPGDARDLTAAVVQLVEHQACRDKMRQAARTTFLSKYTGPANYESLMNIYGRALGREVPAPATREDPRLISWGPPVESLDTINAD